MNKVRRRLVRAACSAAAALAVVLAALSAAASVTAVGGVVACDSPSLISAFSTAVNAGGTQTITLAPGCTYTLTAVNNGAAADTNGLPLITNTVRLTVLGSDATIARDGGAPRFRFLQVESGTSLSLVSVTLTGGYSPDGTSPSSGNGGNGGAVLNNGGTLTVSNGTIRGNRTGAGGSCCSAVTSGHGGQGGGIYTIDGVVVVISSTLAANTTGDGGSSGSGSGGSGGALLSSGGSVHVLDSTISGNVSGNGNAGGTFGAGGFGGGLAASGGTLSVTNSTLAQNATGDGLSGLSGLGGAIFMDSGALTLTNSTVASNTVGANGSAVILSTSPVLLKNDLLAGNTGGECGSSLAPGSTNNMTDSSCGSGYIQATAAQINLGPLQDNGGPSLSMALRFPSAAIDAGTNAGCPATDQRGMPRPVGMRCDIGAYEFQTALNYLFLPLVRR